MIETKSFREIKIIYISWHWKSSFVFFLSLGNYKHTSFRFSNINMSKISPWRQGGEERVGWWETSVSWHPTYPTLPNPAGPKKIFCQKKLFLYFLNFWSIPSKKGNYWSKANLSVQGGTFCFHTYFETYQVKLWTSIKVSHRLDKHFSICFLILLFFLQLAEFNLKASLYLKTLHYARNSISRAPSPFRSIYNRDRGNSPCVNVALKKCKIKIFYFFIFLRQTHSMWPGGIKVGREKKKVGDLPLFYRP